MFDLVIFDNDGVLVDSEWHANGILAALLTECGLPCTRERSIADYLGTTMASVRGSVALISTTLSGMPAWCSTFLGQPYLMPGMTP